MAQLSHRAVEHLRGQLEAMQHAHLAAILDHNRGRSGVGAGMAAHVSRHHMHGGSLAVFTGRGIDSPSYAEYEAHLGEGFGSWIKKIASLGKKAVSKVATHAKAAFDENKDALKSIAKGAAEHVMSSEGSLKERLAGGVAKAAGETASLARAQAGDRIRNLIS